MSLSVPLKCVLAFAGVQMTIVSGVVAYRINEIFSGVRKANQFSATQPEGAPWYQRLTRAHVNCVENLPIFASVVLAGHVAGHSSPFIDRLCQIVVLARVGQALAHISSGSELAVNIRALFYITQMACFGLLIHQHLTWKK